MNGLDPVLVDAAKTIGLFDTNGDLSSSWFQSPYAQLQTILSDSGQRAALRDLIDQLWKPENPPNAPANEEWHPLLGDQALGNLYLTIANGAGPVTIGIAGELHSSTSPLPAELRVHLPLIQVADTGVELVAGGDKGPFQADLRVELNWSPATGQSIRLSAIDAKAVIAPLSATPVSLHIVLEGLSLDGSAPQDTELDPANLDSEAFRLVTGLLREKLRQVAASGAAGEAGAMAAHLMPLFGLADGFPAFPFATLTTDSAAFRKWIAALLSAGKLADWLGHLGAIFGGDSAAAGSGTAADPWRVRIFTIDANSQVDATLAQVIEEHTGTQRLEIGIKAAYTPGGAHPPARIDATATIVSIPLAGSTAAAVLPDAAISVVAPGDPAGQLVNADAIVARSLLAGARWNGSAIVPQLELAGVKLNLLGQTDQYDLIDLTQADSVIGAASKAIVDAVLKSLGAAGGGAGAHLAALAGLIPPAGDPGSTNLANFASLVANPTQAIAAVHRTALLDPTHNWSFLFQEAAALAGIAGPVSGTGTPADPWRVPIEAGTITIELAAWNQQQSLNAADPQQLRIGLRASANSRPWNFWWLAELLAFDLPQNGAANVSLMAGQHAAFVLQPAPAVPATAGIAIAADSFSARMDWSPGSSMNIRASVQNLAVTAGATTVNIASLVFPPPSGFDIANPAATLGVSAADLETMFRLVFSRALFAWAGSQGLAVSALLGLNGSLPGLQADWPVIGANLFSDPFGALRDWIASLIATISADGTPFLPNGLAWLAGLLNGNLPADPSAPAPPAIDGSGTYVDPWAVSVASGTDLLCWLEPAGPPASWAAPLAGLISSSGTFGSLLDVAARLAPFVPAVHEALDHSNNSALSLGLDTLTAWLSASDGFVPFSSQIPNGGTWTAGTALSSAHLQQPSDPQAITQVNAQVAAWNPAGKVVLLLGPAFSDHTIWNDLLAAVPLKPNFDLRVSGVDPASVDLRGVTDASDFYTADLAENGLAGVAAQVGRVVARIGELRPGIPVTLVAHSTAGLAARVFTAANPTLVRGLITIGTPHLGSPLFPLTDPDGGTALRALSELTPSLPAGPIRDALQALVQAADGWSPAAGAGQLPVAAPFPIAAFTAPGSTDTAGVPALAIGSQLTSDLLSEVRQALGDIATAAAAAATPAPTHLGFGARAAIDFGSSGAVQVESYLRADAFRIPLQANAAQPPAPMPSLTVHTALSNPGGWLAGGPADDVRVRWAELELYLAPGTIAPRIRLHDTAFHSPALGSLDLSSPQALPLLGAVFHEIASPPPTSGTALSALLAALNSLAITVADPQGGVGISSDALNALSIDPLGFLLPHLRSALDAGLAGFIGPAGGPYTLAIGSSAFEAYIQGSTLGVRTKTPLPLGGNGSATIDARITAPDLQAAFDLGVTLGAVTLTYADASHTLTLTSPPWVNSLVLFPPPAAADLAAALSRAVPRLLLSAATSALIEGAIGPGFSISALDAFFESPGAHAVGSSALGNGSCLDGSKIDGLLQAVAVAAGLPPGTGLPLPGNLQLTVSGTNGVTLQLSTTAAIGGVVSFQLAANIDCSLHVTPSGTLSVAVPLPAGLDWSAVNINFGVDASGISLSFAPQVNAPNPPIAPIQLLPSFSGLGALAGAAEALLPSALDALVGALGPSTLLNASLQVAQAFDLYDPVNGFKTHAPQLRSLLAGDWAATLDAAVRTTAIPAIAGVLSQINGTISTAGNRIVIGAGGMFSAALGWDPSPTVVLQATGLKAADGAVSADVGAGFIGGAVAASVTVGFHLQSSTGIAVVPQIAIAFSGGKFNVTILPLGTAEQAALSIVLAPALAVNTNSSTAAVLAEDLLLPIAADLLTDAAKPLFGRSVWPGGPITLGDLLTGAGIVAGGNLASPLPDLQAMVVGLFTKLATAAPLTIGNLRLTFVSDATGLGVNLRGSQDIALDSVQLTLHFENLDVPATGPGVTVYLFRNPAALQLSPKLTVRGLGLEFSGPGGNPLVNNSSFRLESAGGYLFFDFDGSLSNLGGAVQAKGVGLPLSLLGGPHDGGNPVASSLLEGAGGTNGDPEPVNPAVDVLVFFVNGSFGIQIVNPSPPLWIGVHRQFGPIYIEQIGVEWDNSAADLLVDGSVKVGPLNVQAYELGLNIRFQELLAPDHWTLDLQGLAVGFESGPVTISGGLIKNAAPTGVEYDGMLSCDISGRGFTVVGGYARPKDGQGDYTSLFIFVSLPIPLGGPPFLFVTGLGGGAGYNRELTPPTDLNQIPSFFLVEAIDDDSLANNPMGALVSMVKNVPPRRGSLWLAAGVRFNSFVVVNTVAVVYVALDRGFEIGILGVSRMQLPAPGIELVNIELALKARFSSAEAIFSIQAQLTDNSWLFSPDCQLTGGFAFFIWFQQGHFVLTMGGFHPAFQPPPEFPIVPRLGFHWQVLGFVQIKGEAYFAITSSAFMCGGRLEASAQFSALRAWFTIHTDFLIQWDPFHYDFEVGVQVGVSLTIEVCFFGACADVSITISRGADVHIFGPPFHVDVTFDAYITSITLSFGGDPNPRPDPLLWEPFRDKYLISGNPENTWIAVRVVQGLLEPEPPGAQPSPGTADDPWKLKPEFAFLTESRMPVSGYSAGGTFDAQGAVVQLPFKTLSDSHVYDLAPMDKLKVGSNHVIRFFPPVTHPNQFVVEEVSTLVPEASWRWYDPAHLPAAAARIQALTGLQITGVAVLQGKSAAIPISTLVDDDPRYAQPLPFFTVFAVVGALQGHGLTAEALAAISAGADSTKTITAAGAILAGSGFFADARQSVGLPPPGIAALSLDTLKNYRTAPPLLTPLTTGLSMRPVALAAPPAFLQVGPLPPVILEQPRLRAVMQSRPAPVADAPAAVRTTVAKVVADATVLRTAPPRLTVTPGARLERIPAANAPRPTAVTFAPRTLRNAEISALTGTSHTANFAAAAASLPDDGVTIPAGTTHVWEMTSPAPVFEFVGNAAVRVTSMNRAGQIIDDTELVVSKEATLAAAAGCEFVAITCLGASPDISTPIAPGFGAVSNFVASTAAIPAVGWQTGNTLPQVGGSSLLARGAVLLLRRAHIPVFNGQKTTQTMCRVSDALAAQSGVETWLPTATGVVMILLDQQDPTAVLNGDLGIACDGATLAVPPVAGSGGGRRALLYDVTSTDPKAARIAVSVASQRGWALAGVIGLPGRSAEWAARLHGTVPPQLVPDGPLTAAGQLTVRLTASQGGPA